MTDRILTIQPLQEIETERRLLAVIVFLSLGSLFVAILGQHQFDIQPCILCIYQPAATKSLRSLTAASLPASRSASA